MHTQNFIKKTSMVTLENPWHQSIFGLTCQNTLRRMIHSFFSHYICHAGSLKDGSVDPCHGFSMGSWPAILFIKLDLCKPVNQQLNSFINALLVISPLRTQTRLFVDKIKKIQSQLRYCQLGFIIFNTWSRRRRSYTKIGLIWQWSEVSKPYYWIYLLTD